MTLQNGTYGTDGQTDRRTDRQSATQYAAPPREEGRITSCRRADVTICPKPGRLGLAIVPMCIILIRIELPDVRDEHRRPLAPSNFFDK